MKLGFSAHLSKFSYPICLDGEFDLYLYMDGNDDFPYAISRVKSRLFCFEIFLSEHEAGVFITGELHE